MFQVITQWLARLFQLVFIGNLTPTTRAGLKNLKSCHMDWCLHVLAKLEISVSDNNKTFTVPLFAIWMELSID